MTELSIGPAIKPLMWEHEKATTHVPETWRAKSIGREYDIQRTGDGKFDLWADVGTALSVENTLEAAQSAAQAHHNRHIRSALQDSPCCKGLAPITECQCEQDRLVALNKKLTEDFNTVALDRAQWQERAEKLSIALAAEQAINKDLKIELDEALVAFADQKVISNYSREQGIKALAVLKLARPYVARIASRTSGPDVRDHLSKIDALIGKQD